MIKVSLPDGSVKEFTAGVTPMDVAISISEGFARNVISASFDGTIVETTTPLTTDGSLILYTWNDEGGKKAFWHSTSHVMAQVLEENTNLNFVPFLKPRHWKSIKTMFIKRN
jgi:threonyl-tRNA synthetase